MLAFAGWVSVDLGFRVPFAPEVSSLYAHDAAIEKGPMLGLLIPLAAIEVLAGIPKCFQLLNDPDAAAGGDYKFDPIELKYTPRGEEEPIRERVDGPVITVQSASVSNMHSAFLVGIIVVIYLGVFGFRFMFTKRKEKNTTDKTVISVESMQSRLQDARRLRLDGDIAGFLDLLNAVMNDLGAHLFEAQQSTLTTLREQVRYGGQVVDEPTLDRMERKIELELDTRRPKQDDQDKASIELVDEA